MSRQVATLILVCALTHGASALRVSSAWKKEAEKKHGRVAMLAVPALVALGASGVEEPVRWLSQQSVDAQAEFFSAVGVLEAATGLPRLGYNFTIKDGVDPGVYPPLGPASPPSDRVETLLGRIAMLVAAGMMVQGIFL